MVGAELRDQFQHRLQIVDAFRVALRLPGQAVPAQEVRHFSRESRVDEAHAGAIEPGIADHRQLGLERPFRLIGQPPLHRPQRLQNA
jgi:hypothetical protein